MFEDILKCMKLITIKDIRVRDELIKINYSLPCR